MYIIYCILMYVYVHNTYTKLEIINFDDYVENKVFGQEK